MPKYIVDYTYQQDGTMEVEADNEQSARKHVENNGWLLRNELAAGAIYHTLEATVRDIRPVAVPESRASIACFLTWCDVGARRPNPRHDFTCNWHLGRD